MVKSPGLGVASLGLGFRVQGVGKWSVMSISLGYIYG